MLKLLAWFAYGTLFTMAVPAFAGLYLAVKPTRGPRERAFLLRFLVAIHGIGLIFLAILLLGIWILPDRWGFISWVLYPPFILIPATIGSRRLDRIRGEEAPPRA